MLTSNDAATIYYCSAINCTSTKSSSSKLTFFRFPRDPYRCRAWLVIARRTDLYYKVEELNRTHYLCSEHFEESQFINFRRNSLIWNAVPTIFDVAKRANIGKRGYNLELARARRKEAETLPPHAKLDGDYDPFAGKSIFDASKEAVLSNEDSDCDDELITPDPAISSPISNSPVSDPKKGTAPLLVRVQKNYSFFPTVRSGVTSTPGLAATPNNRNLEIRGQHLYAKSLVPPCLGKNCKATMCLQVVRKKLKHSQQRIRRLEERVARLSKKAALKSVEMKMHELVERFASHVSDDSKELVLAQVRGPPGKTWGKPTIWSTHMKNIFLTVYRDSFRAYRMLQNFLEMPPTGALVRHEKELRDLFLAEQELGILDNPVEDYFVGNRTPACEENVVQSQAVSARTNDENPSVVDN